MTNRRSDATPARFSRRHTLALLAATAVAGCGGQSDTPASDGTDTASTSAPSSDTATDRSTGTDAPLDEEETPTPAPADLTWETADDWAQATEQQAFVHASWAPAGEAAVQLGYPPTAPQLRAYYPLNTPGTMAEPDRAGDHDGTQQGTVGSVSGIHNSTAYQFTDGYVAVPTSPTLERDASVTVAFWLQTEADSRAYQDDYMWHQQDGEAQFGVSIDSEGQLYVFTTDDDTLSGPVPTVVNDGAWHHVVMVLNRAEGRVRQYLDGQMDIEVTNYADPVALTPGRAAIGAAADGTKTLDGAIDDIRWYRRALSADEVTALYQGSTSGRLLTSEKILDGSGSPQLAGLNYSLNGGQVEITIFGDRGDTTAERHTVTLDGATEYQIPWQSLHRRFQLELQFTASSPTRSPVVRRIGLD